MRYWIGSLFVLFGVDGMIEWHDGGSIIFGAFSLQPWQALGSALVLFAGGGILLLMKKKKPETAVMPGADDD